MTEILIIEDEQASSDHLIDLLTKSKMNFKIMSVLTSVDDALNWLYSNSAPHIIFMDIHLSDGQSFEIFNKFNVISPVIFVTAFNDYAIQAFKTTGIDYLLKPIDSLDLKQALNRYLENKILRYDKQGDSFNYISNAPSQMEYKERFLVKEGNEYIPIKVEDMAYFYRCETFVFIKLFKGKSYVTNYSLSQLEELLAPHLFLRVNRKIIANINSIECLSRKESFFYIKLRPIFSEDITISQERYGSLKRQLS